MNFCLAASMVKIYDPMRFGSNAFVLLPETFAGGCECLHQMKFCKYLCVRFKIKNGTAKLKDT
jgi:hypothetical protein